MHVFKNTNFGMQQKAHIFIAGLPNLNSFHILGRETESNHLRNEFHFPGVHGAMNRSGSRAK